MRPASSSDNAKEDRVGAGGAARDKEVDIHYFINAGDHIERLPEFGRVWK